MTGIILLIILAIGYALCGDTSGIEAIGKFLLYGALILGIMAIAAYTPWLLITIVIIGIIWIYVSLKNNSKLDKTCNHIESTNNLQNEIIYDNSLTGFKSELQENTKTPLQVQNEKNNEEIKSAMEKAEINYCTIKRNILEQAKSGNYKIINGKRMIVYDYDYLYPSFIQSRSKMVRINKTIFNPDGQIANEVVFTISNSLYYNSFIESIRNLAENEGISIEPLIVNKNNPSISYTLPFRTVGFGESDYHYKFVLRCRISY